MFIYHIYHHNWRNITTIYITRLASNEIFSPSNKIYREVGWAKDLSAPLYEDSITMDLTETGQAVGWIHKDKDRYQ
jgi:hypothetical protein